MKNCPCGSWKTLAACCALIHADESLAVAAEQLMRARYTAFVTANIDFVLRTYHSRCNSHSERDEIAVAAEIDWIKLQIMDSPEAVDDTAYGRRTTAATTRALTLSQGTSWRASLLALY